MIKINLSLLTHLEEVVTKSDFVFISVPTPANNDGSINLEILEECLSEVSLLIKKVNKKIDSIFLIRSTVVPGTTSLFQKNLKT